MFSTPLATTHGASEAGGRLPFRLCSLHYLELRDEIRHHVLFNIKTNGLTGVLAGVLLDEVTIDDLNRDVFVQMDPCFLEHEKYQNGLVVRLFYAHLYYIGRVSAQMSTFLVMHGVTFHFWKCMCHINTRNGLKRFLKMRCFQAFGVQTTSMA